MRPWDRKAAARAAHRAASPRTYVSQSRESREQSVLRYLPTVKGSRRPGGYSPGVDGSVRPGTWSMFCIIERMVNCGVTGGYSKDEGRSCEIECT